MKLPIIVNPRNRQATVRVNGTGLGPTGRPAQAALAVVNNKNRSPNYRAKAPSSK